MSLWRKQAVHILDKSMERVTQDAENIYQFWIDVQVRASMLLNQGNKLDELSKIFLYADWYIGQYKGDDEMYTPFAFCFAEHIAVHTSLSDVSTLIPAKLKQELQKFAH